MVRLAVTLTLLATLSCCTSIAAQDKGFGLGIILGEPTGLSFKKWRSDTTAIGGAVAWSFGKKNELHLHGDYLVHNLDIFRSGKEKLAPYYGIGGRIKIIKDESRLGVRIPLGIDYIFEKASLDVFLEFVPLLDLVPSTNFEVNGAIGIRYFF